MVRPLDIYPGDYDIVLNDYDLYYLGKRSHTSVPT